MMDGDMMGDWSGFGLAGILLNLLLLVGLVAVIAWVVTTILPTRRAQGQRLEERATDSAEEILRERFARGEIEAEEYERSLETLRRKPKERTYEDLAREATRQSTHEQSTRELPRRE